MQLRKSFLQIAELRLVPEEKVVPAHLCLNKLCAKVILFNYTDLLLL
jgi:hypothetical protein